MTWLAGGGALAGGRGPGARSEPVLHAGKRWAGRGWKPRGPARWWAAGLDGAVALQPTPAWTLLAGPEVAPRVAAAATLAALGRG